MRAWSALNRSPWVRRFLNGVLDKPATVLWHEISRLLGSPGQPLSVTCIDTREFVGYCGFLRESKAPLVVEFYCLLRRKFWRRGLAVELTAEMLSVAFDHLRAERVVATVHPDNVASLALVRRLGFDPCEPLARPNHWQDGHLRFQITVEGFRKQDWQ